MGVKKESIGMVNSANIAIAFSIVISLIVVLLTYNTEVGWLGHAVVSLLGLGFVLWIVTTGSILTGRIQKGKSTDVFRTHRKLSIWFAIFMVAAFAYGLLVRQAQGEALLGTPHGWLGLVVALLAVAQIIPSLLIKKRKSIRAFHKVIGFSLALIVVLQVSYGVYVAVLQEIKPLVLAHSVTGAMAALAFVWIIVEMRHLKKNGILRAARAGYVAALFTTLGCWVLGGYNYLTAYRSEVRPVILVGDQSWAHTVIMETKEHIFLFLPVISFLLLMVLLAYSRDDEILGATRVRSAVAILAALGLALTLLMFLMGFLISNAGSMGGG